MLMLMVTNETFALPESRFMLPLPFSVTRDRNGNTETEISKVSLILLQKPHDYSFHSNSTETIGTTEMSKHNLALIDLYVDRLY